MSLLTNLNIHFSQKLLMRDILKPIMNNKLKAMSTNRI